MMNHLKIDIIISTKINSIQYKITYDLHSKLIDIYPSSYIYLFYQAYFYNLYFNLSKAISLHATTTFGLSGAASSSHSSDSKKKELSIHVSSKIFFSSGSIILITHNFSKTS
jgi:hypothetical protein